MSYNGVGFPANKNATWAYRPRARSRTPTKERLEIRFKSPRAQAKTKTTPKTSRRRGLTYTVLGRFRKRLKPYAQKRKNLLAKFQVGKMTTRCSVFNTYSQMSSISYPSKSFWNFLKDGFGIYNKSEYERIKTAEGMSSNDNVVIVNQSCEYLIKNQTDVVLFLDLYIVRLKQPIDGSLYTKMTQSWTDLNVTPSGTYNVGFGLNPFNAPTFKYYFELKGKRHIVLNGGEICTHRLSSKRIFKRTFTYGNDTTHDYLRGEYMILLHMQGGPVHDATTSTLIGTTGGLLDVVATSKIYYRVPEATGEAPKITAASSLETTFPGGQRTFLQEDLAEDAPES